MLGSVTAARIDRVSNLESIKTHFRRLDQGSIIASENGLVTEQNGIVASAKSNRTSELLRKSNRTSARDCRAQQAT